MKDIRPSNKLTTAQRKVAVERAFKKASNANINSGQMQQGAPQSIAAGIVNARNPASPRTTLPMMQQAMPMERPPVQNSVDPMKEIIANGTAPRSTGEISEVDQQIQAALIADQLWKDQGGDESLGGQVWSAYKNKNKNVNHLDSSRDYFVSSFVKWKMNPEDFKKKHPEEARVISALNDEFEASQGGI